MCDDLFDDFDNNFDGESEDYLDDGFQEDDFSDIENDDDTAIDKDGGSEGCPEWQDWMIIGPMSEEIAREKRGKDKAYRDTFGDDYMDTGTDW